MPEKPMVCEPTSTVAKIICIEQDRGEHNSLTEPLRTTEMTMFLEKNSTVGKLKLHHGIGQ